LISLGVRQTYNHGVKRKVGMKRKKQICQNAVRMVEDNTFKLKGNAVKLAEFWWDWSKCCGIKKGMARDGARGIG
jgi:hypothetical protein